MAGYMSFLQLKNYLGNEDLASISFRKFEPSSSPQYPTFTMCISGITGKDGRHFKSDSSAWHFAQTDMLSYTRYLMGENVSKLYYVNGETIQNPRTDTDDFKDINYDEVSMNVFDKIITQFYSSVHDGKTPKSISHSGCFQNNNEDKVCPFPITHQDENQICYSKKISNQSYMIQDAFVLNKKAVLDNLKIGFFIYIHKEGELYRNLIDKKYKSRIQTDALGNTHKFTIDGIEVLTRRADSRIRCNKTIDDEDTFLRGHIMRKIGCVPAYWKRFSTNLSEPNGLASVNCSQLQYQKFYRVLKSDSFSTNSPYLYPCTQISQTIFHLEEKSQGLSDQEKNNLERGSISFHYSSDWYKEILNKRAFTLETFFGQIGGFIGKLCNIWYTCLIIRSFNILGILCSTWFFNLYLGMFLGYSIYHVLQICTKGASAVVNYPKKNDTAKNDDTVPSIASYTPPSEQ